MSTLGWSVPGLLVIPIFVFVLVASSVRSRRAVANTAVFGLLLTLADIVLVAWARFGKFTYFEPNPSYQWLNVPVSFSGASQFNGFGIDISFRVDHLALAAYAVVVLVSLGVTLWQRSAARQEPGPVRFHSALLLAVAGAGGFLVSGDLGASVAWWSLTGVCTYLLLGNRWGSEASTRPARLALAIPFLGDLALLAGVAVLYSRFGTLLLSRLSDLSVLHGTYAAGLRTVTGACLLFALAALVRAGLFPFTAWISASLEAPPAALAWARAAWPVLAFVLLYRTQPLFNGAGPEAYRFAAYAFALAAVGGPLLSLAGGDLRRGIAWASTAPVALVLLGFGQPGASPAGAAAILALAPLTAALTLGAQAITAAVRSRGLEDMGEALRRMPYSAVALGGAAVLAPLAIVPRLAARASWHGWPFLVVAALLFGFALVRLAAVPLLAPLRRRRAFEPARVREVARQAAWAGVFLVALGAVAVVLGYLDPFTRWLVGPAGRVSGGALALHLAVALVGIAAGAAAGALGALRAALSRLTVRFGAGFSATAAAAAALWDRTAAGAGLRVVGAVEEAGLEAAESGLGRSLSGIGASTAAGLAAAPAVATVAIVLVLLLVAAFFGPGVHR